MSSFTKRDATLMLEELKIIWSRTQGGILSLLIYMHFRLRLKNVWQKIGCLIRGKMESQLENGLFLPPRPLLQPQLLVSSSLYQSVLLLVPAAATYLQTTSSSNSPPSFRSCISLLCALVIHSTQPYINWFENRTKNLSQALHSPSCQRFENRTKPGW